MRKTVLLLAMAATAMVLASGAALAVEPYGTVDANDLGAQSNHEIVIANGLEWGQTFVPEHSGQVTGLRLVLYDPYAPTDSVRPNLLVNLYSIPNPFEAQGAIQGKWLALGQITSPEVPASPAPVPVEVGGSPTVKAGHHYAIGVVQDFANLPAYAWEAHRHDLDSSVDAYPDGMALHNPNGFRGTWGPQASMDFLFSVHVNQRPAVSDPTPTPGSIIKVRRPPIAATVKDPETDLTKMNIALFLDGESIKANAFAYDASADRLTYQPPERLPRGKHTVKVVANDERDFAKTKRWSFEIR